MQPNNVLMTGRQLADELGCTIAQIDELRAAGMPHISLPARRAEYGAHSSSSPSMLYAVDVVRAWLVAHRTVRTPQPPIAAPAAKRAATLPARRHTPATSKQASAPASRPATAKSRLKATNPRTPMTVKHDMHPTDDFDRRLARLERDLGTLVRALRLEDEQAAITRRSAQHAARDDRAEIRADLDRRFGLQSAAPAVRRFGSSVAFSALGSSGAPERKQLVTPKRATPPVPRLPTSETPEQRDMDRRMGLASAQPSARRSGSSTAFSVISSRS